MKRKLSYYYRKIHRYFGAIIGIQFLFWTLGGLFFSWSNMDQIHGDTNRKPVELIKSIDDWRSPGEILKDSTNNLKIDSLVFLKSISLLGTHHYQMKYFDNQIQKTVLVNALTGKTRPPANKEEAILLAKEVFLPKAGIKSVKLITNENVNNHHEYRGGPLPAYVISFDHESGTNVYVSTELAQVITFRNANWRIFDFLWMMHTMDYSSRDNIGNILLRTFSILGLITLISGFLLYFKTSRWFRKN